jgi:hypothetical protein
VKASGRYAKHIRASPRFEFSPLLNDNVGWSPPGLVRTRNFIYLDRYFFELWEQNTIVVPLIMNNMSYNEMTFL